MTRIDVISGFLGAGKTTLIKKLISEAYKGEKLVLIENEFGEIGIDGGFLKNAGIEVTEMNSGCICCSLVGDFGTAMKEVVEKYSPDRIIIEPSGVGKLSDVIKAIVKMAEEEKNVKLGNATVVVDAGKCKMYMKNFGEFFNNQVEHAQTIILSRTQNITEDKLNKSIELIREKNDKAAIVTTPWNEITGAKIAEAMDNKDSMAEELMAEMHEHHHHEHDEHCECGCHDHDHHEHHHEHHDHDHHEHHHHEHDEHCECGCHDHDHEHHHHHHADEVFTSWGKETHKKYSEEFIKDVLEKFEDESYGIILRAKGIVQAESGEWLEFDYTPGEYEIRKGSADYTGRLCVIGSKLDTAKIEELFDK